jgi:hypothetical protein
VIVVDGGGDATLSLARPLADRVRRAARARARQMNAGAAVAPVMCPVPARRFAAPEDGVRPSARPGAPASPLGQVRRHDRRPPPVLKLVAMAERALALRESRPAIRNIRRALCSTPWEVTGSALMEDVEFSCG